VPVVSFFVVDMSVDDGFRMGCDKIFEGISLALDRGTHAGMADVQRNPGPGLANELFEQLRAT